MWEILKIILESVAFLFGVFLVFTFIVILIKNNWKNWWLAIIHAVICQVLVLFFLDVHFENSETNRILFTISKYFNDVFPGNDLDDTDRFILVDNSGNKTLIPDMNANAEDSCMISITDRGKLARLAKLCVDHIDEIELVVLDIRFEDSTHLDSALKVELTKLAAANKLLLAGGWEKNPNALGFNESYFAAAETDNQAGEVTHFQLFKEEKLSLPYKMYLLSNGISIRTYLGFYHIEKAEDGKMTSVRSSMIPGLGSSQLTDQSGDIQQQSWNEAKSIGYFMSEYGQIEFTDRLQMQSANKKAIVFVGEFEGSDVIGQSTDVHKTVMGNLHGSRIILDIYKDLLNKSHRLFHLAQVIQLVFLFIASMLIFRNRSNEKSERNDRRTKIDKAILRTIWDESKIRMVEFLGLIFLIVVFVVTSAWSGTITNFTILLAYFIVLNVLMDGVKEELWADSNKKNS